MAIEMKTDKLGGEYKIDEGTELYAIWIPVTLTEKEALIDKGKADGVDVPRLAANLLRSWLKSAELSDGELEKVAGGAGLMAAPLPFPEQVQLSQKLLSFSSNLRPGRPEYSTVMCPW